MKKNVLALSIAAMFGGFRGVSRATVFSVDEDGRLAEIPDDPESEPNMLVVPYYTGGQSRWTASHIQPYGRPVKIKFRGGPL